MIMLITLADKASVRR